MAVVLAVGGLVFGLVSAIGIRLQRQLAQQAARLSSGEQLGAAADLIPMDLRSLSSVSEDIRSGQARDTSVELRAAIASAVVCEGAPGTLLLAPYLAANGRNAPPPIQVGDTLWLLTDADGNETWRPVATTAVRSGSGSCSLLAAPPGESVFDMNHLVAVDIRDTIPNEPGSVIRVTRPIRYSFYRSGDGHWYLGMRSWNATAGAFNSVQPLAGPFAAPASGTRFDYFDSTDNALSLGTSDTRSVARIETILLSEQSTATSAAMAHDSIRVVVAVRNRR
jgi:hypothetical protein